MKGEPVDWGYEKSTFLMFALLAAVAVAGITCLAVDMHGQRTVQKLCVEKTGNPECKR